MNLKVIDTSGKISESPMSYGSGGPTGNSMGKAALAKVSIGPGFSQLDWVRLTASGKDLRGVKKKEAAAYYHPRKYTRSELAKHNTKDDAWMAIKGNVYNVTAYSPFHPGGPDELMRGVGDDATVIFEEIHPWVNVEFMLKECYLGPLCSPAEEMAAVLARDGSTTTTTDSKIKSKTAAIIQEGWMEISLRNKKEISKNTFQYTFDLPDGKVMHEGNIGQHIKMRLIDINGRYVERPYTPISLPNATVEFNVVIKHYGDGAFSKLINNLKIGGKVLMKGPSGGFSYTPTGTATWGNKIRKFKQVIMLGAGSGITPMIQVALSIIQNPKDETVVHMICCHRNSSEIILHKELLQLSEDSSRFSVTFHLSKEDSGSKRLSVENLKPMLPEPSDEVIVLFSGPFGFNQTIERSFKSIGFNQDNLFCFDY